MTKAKLLLTSLIRIKHKKPNTKQLALSWLHIHSLVEGSTVYGLVKF